MDFMEGESLTRACVSCPVWRSLPQMRYNEPNLRCDRRMSSDPSPLSTDIEQYLRQHGRKDLLRFITCGSVDDGKSTLIGRLLYESKQIFDDQLAALESNSKRHGTQGEGIDFALLVDGLSAEREQGITID